MTIILHCYYPGQDGSARKFAEEMISSGLQQEVLNEEGCLQYDYFVSSKDGETVALLEKWRDAATLDAHQVGEPMKKIQALKAKYGLSITVERYELND